MGEKKEPGPTPVAAGVSLPFAINKSMTASAEALTSLYHTSERGMQGTFPLGAAAQFHCGTDLLVERGKPICAIARGEVVAARIGVVPGEHPWGDTGFVLLRHPLEGGKSIFCLFVHLEREPLNPSRTHAGWLRRLLLDAAGKQAIAALKEGKVAILEADKKDGKRRWTVEAGEQIGVAGSYRDWSQLEKVAVLRGLVHWSMFCKDAVFPTGSLPEKGVRCQRRGESEGAGAERGARRRQAHPEADRCA